MIGFFSPPPPALGEPPPPAAPVITGSPTIAGTVAVGETLTASPASASGNPSPTRTWQWTRDGVDISGETAATYQVSRDDEDVLLRVRQIETNSEGSDNATSDPAPRMLYGDDFAADSSGEWSLGQDAVDGTKGVAGGSLVYTKGAGDGLRPRIVRALAVTASTQYRVVVPAPTGTANRKETWISTASNGDFGAAITTITVNAALDETFTPSVTPVYLVMRAGTDSAAGETVAISSATVREE